MLLPSADGGPSSDLLIWTHLRTLQNLLWNHLFPAGRSSGEAAFWTLDATFFPRVSADGVPTVPPPSLVWSFCRGVSTGVLSGLLPVLIPRSFIRLFFGFARPAVEVLCRGLMERDVLKEMDPQGVRWWTDPVVRVSRRSGGPGQSPVFTPLSAEAQMLRLRSVYCHQLCLHRNCLCCFSEKQNIWTRTPL